MNATLDMAEALERQGIRAVPGNHPCPDCGSRTGLSVNFRKDIASCFACGKKYFPVSNEHDESWIVKFLTWMYKRCRAQLDTPEKSVEARAYLLGRGLEPEDYAHEPIGVIPSISSEKWVAKARGLRDEEDAKLNKRLSEADKRNIKLRRQIQKRLEENDNIFMDLEGQLTALAGATGWLAFFYVNATQDFVSVNIRQCGGHGYKQVKPTSLKGIFSPMMGDVPAKVLGDVLLVEGEFNLLTLRKAYRNLNPIYQLTSAALGSASSWDATTVRSYFDGLELCVNYDNDSPGFEAVNKLAETGSLWAFAVPTGNTKQNDADYWIRTYGLLEYAREWSQANKIYRSWESCRKVLDEIANEENISERDRHHAGLELVRKLLLERGTIYNCGNVATFVDNDSRSITEIVKGGLAFGALMERLGIYAGDKFLPPDIVGKSLGSFAQGCEKKTIYTMSHYDREKHVLYVNEYGGYFLRIDGNRNIERLQNGDDGMLFTDGATGECDPLHADIDLATIGSLCSSPLQVDGGLGLIKSNILDTLIYPDMGVGKENAQLIIITAILGLFFPERIPSMPFLTFHGITASMKTSLCNKVGKLIQGRKFRVRPATDDIKELKDMAISIPFLVLDEANNIRKLIDILKTIATGGMDTRRELYTTANVRNTPYQARIWMTSNTASLSNESISNRLMIIDAGARTEENPYRSEFYLDWNEATRNDIWSELIGRLTAAMLDLANADKAGQGDLSVSHRMSSFFVFGLALAKASPRDGDGMLEEQYLGAMKAMGARQRGASLEGNEIVELLEMVDAVHNGKFLPAREWVGVLQRLVPMGHHELLQKVCRTGWVAYQLAANEQLLTDRFGMTKQRGQSTETKNILSYRFTKFGQFSTKSMTAPEVLPDGDAGIE